LRTYQAGRSEQELKGRTCTNTFRCEPYDEPTLRGTMKGKYPEYDAVPITDVRDMFIKSSEKFADKVALQHKKDGRWIPITYRNLRMAVEQIAGGLAAFGLRPVESKVAIVGDNRPEWAISYLEAACTGIVCVPLDKDLKETEVYHILYLSG